MITSLVITNPTTSIVTSDKTTSEIISEITSKTTSEIISKTTNETTSETINKTTSRYRYQRSISNIASSEGDGDLTNSQTQLIFNTFKKQPYARDLAREDIADMII
ncbi:9054_t:CDS:2 [Dentiscutata erythropus]|uniref:9054_t:CDS:1 n=1 Tax=Dentiscutata erythropus TaxID=1348616 RepID=A0A9N9NQ52_9GLOM|nr:9054_t:CDS:2 [Dentiscutata erythropus]